MKANKKTPEFTGDRSHSNYSRLSKEELEKISGGSIPGEYDTDEDVVVIGGREYENGRHEHEWIRTGNYREETGLFFRIEKYYEYKCVKCGETRWKPV